jgi:signal transduction histidine kinase
MQPMNFSNFFSTINSKEVLTNLPDAVMVIEEDGLVSWVNDKTLSLFAAGREEILGKHFEEMVIDGIKLMEKSHIKKTSYATGAINFQGKEFFIELNSKRYGMQYFVTLRNTTQMTSILSQSEKTGQMNRDKNLMLTKFSGDFKSPLQSIIGFSQSVLDNNEESLTEKQQKYLTIINKNSKELLYFMDKFFDFSAVESSAFVIKRRVFDIILLIQNICKDNELNIQNKKLSFVLNFENLNSKTVYTDENALKQVLQQILEMAISLTEIGTISIDAETLMIEDVKNLGIYRYTDEAFGDYIKILIKDTGMGISSSEMKNIFNPYALMDSSNKKAILHAIMMATVENVITKLGGVVKINTEIMKGSEFEIILPIAKDKEIDNE